MVPPTGPPTSNAPLLSQSASSLSTSATALSAGTAAADRSDGDGRTDLTQLMPGHRQVGLLPVQRQVQEQPAAGAGLQQPDQVVLVGERDEDVVDLLVQLQRGQRAHLRPDHLG